MQIDLFDLRQLGKGLESEHAQEIRCRLIDDGPARYVQAAAFTDELFCREGADAVGAVNAADLLDKRLGRGLIVRDDRQRFELRRLKLRRLARFKRFGHTFRHFRR